MRLPTFCTPTTTTTPIPHPRYIMSGKPNGSSGSNRLSRERDRNTPSPTNQQNRPITTRPWTQLVTLDGRDYFLVENSRRGMVPTVLTQTRMDEYVVRPTATRSGSGSGGFSQHSAGRGAWHNRGGGRGGGGGVNGDGGNSRNPGPGDEPRAERPSSNRLDEASLSGDRERAARASLADETLKAIEDQKYKTPDGKEWSLVGPNKKLEDGTKFIPHGYFKGSPSPPTAWEKISPVDFQERSTVAAARDWVGRDTKVRIGVLNFASATRRGGGFKNGAQAQEESLARASNLYFSLSQKCADQFYETHQKDDRDGFYSNAMIYSKDVTMIRDEKDTWAPPMTVDMVTSAAVNAGLVRRRMSGRPFRRDDVEKDINGAMFERMGKILQLFVEKKVRVLVLGSFGTGVFQNSIQVVATCWAELLGNGGPFSQSFDHVEFAILGGSTFRTFREAYAKTLSEQLYALEESTRS